MRHLAKFSKGRFDKIPFHVECSCGVAGDFATEAEATYWMQYKHFAKLTGIAYGEFYSAPTPSGPTSATGSASEGGKPAESYTPKIAAANTPIKSFPPKAGA